MKWLPWWWERGTERQTTSFVARGAQTCGRHFLAVQSAPLPIREGLGIQMGRGGAVRGGECLDLPLIAAPSDLTSSSWAWPQRFTPVVVGWYVSASVIWYNWMHHFCCVAWRHLSILPEEQINKSISSPLVFWWLFLMQGSLADFLFEDHLQVSSGYLGTDGCGSKLRRISEDYSWSKACFSGQSEHDLSSESWRRLGSFMYFAVTWGCLCILDIWCMWWQQQNCFLSSECLWICVLIRMGLCHLYGGATDGHVPSRCIL